MLEFNYEDYIYTPAGSKVITEKALRREYSRLRAVAVKRLQRIGESEFSGYDIFKTYNGVFKKLAEFENETELRYTFSELYNFLNKKTSTVTGQRKRKSKIIATMHERGYTFINNENFKSTIDFLDRMKEKGIEAFYGSEKVTDTIQQHFEDKGRVDEKYLNSLEKKFEREFYYD